MKKNTVRKLQLSRETLQALTLPDIRKAVGGAETQPSCQSQCLPCWIDIWL